MSRMLALVTGEPLSLSRALGPAVLADFGALARVHADGWGHVAATAATSPVVRDAGVDAASAGLADAGSSPARVHVASLRFASAGSAVRPENVQPFAVGCTAFAHNGALVPRSAAEAALTPEERASLVGDTDSEVYFALVRRALAAMDGAPASAVGPAITTEAAIGSAVADVRALYPAACLNAFVLHRGELFVVHAPGTVPPPLAAFAARGFAPADLPPGHDASYNELRTALLPSGARAVATTGIGGEWHPLPRDTVTRIPPACPLSPVPLPA